MGISQAKFRKALACFATGVTVITVARGADRVHGMTANAFCSVSLEPPLVLVCVDHESNTRPLLLSARRFGVNVLRDDQQDVARYFAETEKSEEGATRLGIRYQFTERGTPLLETALAQLDCALVATHEAGDHTLFIAEVEAVVAQPTAPLLFYGGGFRRLSVESS